MEEVQLTRQSDLSRCHWKHGRCKTQDVARRSLLVRCSRGRTIVQETGEDARGRCVIAGAGVLVRHEQTALTRPFPWIRQYGHICCLSSAQRLSPGSPSVLVRTSHLSGSWDNVGLEARERSSLDVPREHRTSEFDQIYQNLLAFR